MPNLTPHYNLTAFSFGDTYSASADRRRFSIIDNQLWFLAQQIGDGVIDGWVITAKNGETVVIAPGMGVIDGFLTTTYGNLEYTIPNNRRMYLYMRRKPNVISETGAFSDVESIVYSDTTTPSTPAQPTAIQQTFQSVKIGWAANAEADFAHYEVHRHLVTNGYSSSSSSSPFVFEHVADVDGLTYLDEDVADGSIYEYKLRAVDYNNHKSGFSPVLTVLTPYDLRIPSDPTEIDVLTGNNSLQVYWGASNFLVKSYRLTLQPITLDGIPDGSATIVNVSDTTFYHIFEGLDNGRLYEISVSAVSKNNVTSAGVTGRGTPFYSGGATELKSITVSDFAIDSSYRIGLNLTWELQDDEYALYPDYYLVTIYRDGETGVGSVYTSTSNIITRYTVRVGNTDVTRDIEEESKYTIKIQTVSGDATSNGFVIRFKTKKFRSPQPISNLEITTQYDINTRSVIATWQNSQTTFAYNSLTVKKIPLDVEEEYTDDMTEYLELNRNYGQSTQYSVKIGEIENFHRYEFYLTVHDVYGNTSSITAGSAVIAKTFQTTSVGGLDIPNSGERPPAPSELFSVSGNDQGTLYWNKAESDFIKGYKVYRADFANGYQPSDFTVVTETSADVRKFTDYTIDNGNRYVYFVTTVDVFDNESLNPSDNYIFYSMAFISPRSHSSLSKAPAISVASSGHDAVLSWTIDDDGGHDGYQIFRSETNNYSFVPVGSCGPLDNSFTDTNALIKNGSYFYMIRKFRNEAELYASRNRLAPAGSLALGIVSRFGSTITINQDAKYDIKLLADPIRDKVATALSKPTHLFFGVGDDRRIRLQDNLVITEWSTLDYQTYSTEYGMIGTNEYIAYIDGVQSPYGTTINRENGTISFEQPIFDASVNDGKSEDEQIDPPSVMVIFTHVSEITGVLPQANLEDISAVKITKGKIPIENLPVIDHFGRWREACLPARSPLTLVNAQTYSGTTPNGITFYDVIKTPDNRIMAATSAGVMMSSTLGGSSLNAVLTGLASRVIYCPYLQMYFAAVGNHVKMSKDGTLWVMPSGMDGTVFVRDLVSDEQGKVYASTDAGVYKIEPLEFTKLFWTQLNLFDSNDPNAFGIAFDTNELFVSGSNGIYKTSNDGNNWAKITDKEIQVPLYSIFIDGDYIFGVSNNKVWRKTPSEAIFRVIGDFASPCRKGVLFGNDFFVTTDHGLYRSSSESDVFVDENVKWDQSFLNLNRNGLTPTTHALRILDGRLWMGQDERLYSATTQGAVYTHADVASVCPTIYVGDTERSVGVFYSHANQVVFDSRQNADDELFIVRSYTNFTIKNGGWADLKYDAEILINVNGTDIIGPPITRLINGRYWKFPPAPWVPPNDTETVAKAVGGITTPFFNGRNSSFDKAMASLKKIVQMSDAIQTLDYLGEVETVPAADVANLFIELDRFKSLIHPELRPLIKYPAITGVVNYNGFTALYDVVNGTLEITNGVDKYSRVTISIKGVSLTNNGVLTHYDLETGFEKWNSGLSPAMALVQQSNLVKAGIYHQRNDAGALDGFKYQAEHFSACDGWYDKFQSTIDYDQKVEQLPQSQGQGVYESSGFSLDYPADVLYVPTLSEVWVCGAGGIIAVNKTTYSTRKVYGSPFYFYNMVLSGGIVHALAEDGLYEINPSNGVVKKNVVLTPPEGFSSVYVNANTTYIATKDGVYSRRPFEVSWSKVFDLNEATIRSSPKLTFAVGKNVNDATDGLVYYSFGGVVWNRSNTFTDIIVNGATQRYNSVYYATNSGLIHEDLSKLFSNSDFSGPILTAVELEEDEDGSQVTVNDVDADDDLAIAVTDDGKWYSMSGGTVIDSGHSQLPTIHKVKVIDGKYWFFMSDLVEIENATRLVQLSTGIALV